MILIAKEMRIKKARWGDLTEDFQPSGLDLAVAGLGLSEERSGLC